MKANPGGNIGASDVVGRDDLIACYWKGLREQSLVLSAERRMGKTCIIKKMREEAPEDWIAVFHDLESVGTPLAFTRGVISDIENYLARAKKISNQMRAFRKKLSGVKVGLLQVPEAEEPHWKDLLIETLGSLSMHQDRLVVFFWDEVPLMLEKIKKTAGENEAMDLLDTLRSLRQTCANLRMVFTGSIGLHHVLASLRKAGYANTPLNDMKREEVPPLSEEAGQHLACRLFEGEEIRTADPKAMGLAITRAVDGIPYFIHHVAGQAARIQEELTLEGIEKIVRHGLTHSLDAWDMLHYRNRIDAYFAEQEAAVALVVLDILAHETAPLDFAALFNLVKAEVRTEDQELLREVMLLLKNDHYVEQDGEGDYRFKFPLVRRWWKMHRGT